MRMSTTDQVVDNGVKMLVYAEAGAGKTTLCATALSPVIFSAEAGLLSLRHVKINVIEIKTVEELEEAYNWAVGSQEAAQYGTLCLDSISEIAEVVLTNAKRQFKDPRQAYGELIDKVQKLLRDFRDIKGKHVYMSAKIETFKDEMTGVVRYLPGMPGSKLGPSIPYLFDEVFWLGIGKTPEGKLYRFLQTQPDVQRVCKDRSGALDPIEEPNLTNVIAKIQAKKAA